MTILGISASARENSITAETVLAVLKATGEQYEFLSLATLDIRGCDGCTRCAVDNRCKLEDDWLLIGEKMLAAEAVSGDVCVIEVGEHPPSRGVTVVTGVSAGDMRRVFTHCDRTVVTARAGANDLGVINGIRWYKE